MLGLSVASCGCDVKSVVVHLGMLRWRLCAVRYVCNVVRYVFVFCSMAGRSVPVVWIVMSSAYCVMLVSVSCGVGMSCM